MIRIGVIEDDSNMRKIVSQIIEKEKHLKVQKSFYRKEQAMIL